MKTIKGLLFAGALMLFSAYVAEAQTRDMATTLTSGVLTATVTNTGTGVLVAEVPEKANIVTIQFEATETSGTTAGTVSLYGSIDGTHFRSISSTTFTATDVATQGFIWTVTSSPCRYYEITWTGTGTMVDTFVGKVRAN